jgi:hypothetical protein
MSAGEAIARRRQVLLAMLSGVVEPDGPSVAAFANDDWEAIALMARQHRLEGLLHTALRQRGTLWPVPQDLRDCWKARHKQVTIRAMTCQQALKRTAALLAQASVPFAVLKGGWLAWAAYPDPAQRALRDIDFLVPQGHAAAAFAALEEAGYTRKQHDVTPIDHALHHAKHLPPLFCPASGVAVELHTRIIHDVPEGDLTGTIGDNAALLARSVPRDLGGFTVPCLSPTDTLLHLMVHAAHDHQFDNGPLVLNDIAVLVQTCPIDWPLLQHMAVTGGWQRGSAMLLRLTDHYHGPLAIPPASLEPSPHDPGMLEAAAQLMLVDLRSSVDTHFRAGLQSGNSLRGKLDFLLSRAVPKRHALAAFAGLPLESPWIWLHYPAWLLARSRQRLLADGGPGQEEDRRNLQTINEWLRA